MTGSRSSLALVCLLLMSTVRTVLACAAAAATRVFPDQRPGARALVEHQGIRATCGLPLTSDSHPAEAVCPNVPSFEFFVGGPFV